MQLLYTWESHLSECLSFSLFLGKLVVYMRAVYMNCYLWNRI